MELKKRIAFASIGLNLCLTEAEIENELRRSIGAEITKEGLRQTITLNAKSLIERDADFSLFAGRILLSYIYEEVLDWSILTDGIEGLKAAHTTAFKKYLKHGVNIKRLSPELIDGRYNLDKIAEQYHSSSGCVFLWDSSKVTMKTNRTGASVSTTSTKVVDSAHPLLLSSTLELFTHSFHLAIFTRWMTLSSPSCSVVSQTMLTSPSGLVA